MKKEMYSATGYGPIDGEHLKLGGDLQAVVQQVNHEDVPALKEAMRRLVCHVGDHFAHEERLLREFGAPNEKRHAEAHQIFLADVIRFQRELDQSGLTPTFRRWAVGRLTEWFRIHILAHDMGLAQFILKAEAARHALDKVA